MFHYSVDDDNSPEHETESSHSKRRRRHQHRTHQVSAFSLPIESPPLTTNHVDNKKNNSPLVSQTHKDIMLQLSSVQSKEDLAKSMCNLSVTPPIGGQRTVNNNVR